MKVAIILINFNGEKDTLECLDSLENLSSFINDIVVVVVDNASKKMFKSSKKYKRFELKVIRSERNLGFAGGNNLGIRYALENGADYIMLLNNDTYVDPSIVDELINAYKENENAGIVAPKIYFAKGFEFQQKYKESEVGKVIWYAGGKMDWKNVYGTHRGVDEVDKGQYGKNEITDFASGCCFLTSRQVLEKAGMLNEKYFLYYEESDLCERIKREGYNIYYVPKAILWHKNAQSTGGSGSVLQDYFITRNRMLFGITYAPIRTKLALLKESIKLLLKGRKWQKIGIIDFYKMNFGQGSFNPD